MKFLLTLLITFNSLFVFAQNDTDKQNTELTNSIHYNDGSSAEITEDNIKDFEDVVIKVLSCHNKEGKCTYKGKSIDKLIFKAFYEKSPKSNKAYRPEYNVYTPLNFSEVFTKPIRKAQLTGLPRLMHKGENYDFYEGGIIASGHKDFAILTKPNSKDVVAIISARYFVMGKVFNYKPLLENSKKMFSNTEEIKQSLKKKEYKETNYNPYIVLDKAGKLIDGKKHFLF